MLIMGPSHGTIALILTFGTFRWFYESVAQPFRKLVAVP